MLIILCIIPIIGWALLMGFTVRVYRGGEAKLGEWIKMLIDGILVWIIGIVYSIVPMIVLFIFGGAALMNPMLIMDPEAAAAATAGVSIIGLIIFLIVALIFGIMSSMAIVRFAKEESLGAAFQFGEIFKIIGKIGWIHYILSIIILAIIFAVIGFICGLLMIVLIGFILILILFPFLCIWQARFVANLYESA
ncbi:MAG: DUF4013 domain-containing protein [Methanocalculaceae archaeon]|nr:DUF4013 domain-containing protein [Methanocalculaceae archaeon]